MLTGIDVSSHNGATPPMDGKTIIEIKASEGTFYVNEDLSSQVAEARKDPNRRVHFYHYGHPKLSSAADEVAYFAKAVAPYLRKGDVLCLDWEFYTPSDAGTTPEQADAFKDEWFTAAAQAFATHRRILYTNRDRWFNFDVNSNCGDGLWIADITTPGQPRIEHAWIGHQYGQAGGIDQDVWNFSDLATYDHWAAGNEPPSFKVQPVDYTITKPDLPELNVGWLKAARYRDPSAAQGHTSGHGAMVKLFETMLSKVGLLDKRWIDGSYGTKTVEAVQEFQKRYSGAVSPDGWMGPKELALLSKLSHTPVNIHL